MSSSSSVQLRARWASLAVVAALAAGLLVAAPALADPATGPAAGPEVGVDVAVARPDWWSAAPQAAARAGADDVRVDPERAFAFRVDAAGAGDALDRADAGATLVLPDPRGEPVAFEVERTRVLAPALAAAHPGIATYAGRALDDSRRTVRVDLTPMGLHASVRSLADGRSWYVDPTLDEQGATRHVAYRPGALPDDGGVFVERGPEGLDDAARVTGDVPRATSGGRVTQRVYRLALLNDPAYSERFGSRSEVLAEKTTLVNRVNQIYSDDLGISLRLVGGTTRLDLATKKQAIGANGPCGTQACFRAGDLGSCTARLLGANQSATDRILGARGYDIGHVVLGRNGGGVAGLGVVGERGQKARGCTGLTDPVGDVFYVDYVAHEMGHQFDANHTFDGTGGACAGANRVAGTSVEPGSGSSVMGYAGICGADDLQRHSDPYFSQRSLSEISSYVGSARRHSGATTLTANHAPVVSAPADRTIPALTPFTLEATGTDQDDPTGSGLTYLWEQDDDGGRAGAPLAREPRTDGPLFRVFGDDALVDDQGAAASPSPGQNRSDGATSRTFPDLAQVLAGNTNAQLGDCSAAAPGGDRLDCLSELLPVAAYAPLDPLSFRVTARDGATTGGTGFDDVELSVAGDAGPFEVTSQATGKTVPGGGAGSVTWEVNGTATPALAPQVRILLSTDGGVTFDTVLEEATANDGAALVTWPDVATTTARVKVEAVGNYFFDVNDAAFAIDPDTAGTAPETRVTSGPPAGGFSLRSAPRVRYESSARSPRYDCTLDRADLPCDRSQVGLGRLAPGTHVFTVASRDVAGSGQGAVDTSPARVRWARPLAAGSLHASGAWRQRSASSAYLGGYQVATERGATLRRKVDGVRRLALVVTRGPGDGRLAVGLGGRRVAVVDLGARRVERSRLVVLPAFDRVRSGRLRVRSLSAERVRVEGVGVLTR